MTRKEAIKKINAVKKYLTAGNPIWDVKEIDEALDMAIKALQTKGVGRYENAMQKLREMPRYLNGVKEKQKAKSVKHGYWKEEYNGNGWNDFWDYTCSVCGKKWERADDVLYTSNFCPNCGAKMSRKDDE